MKVTLCNFGARITGIEVLLDGLYQPMLCSYQDKNRHEEDPFYLGAVCGPVCNRISQAQFMLNDETYQLDANENGNTLHSGAKAISNQFWTVSSVKHDEVIFSLTVKHLDDHFPGNRIFRAAYTLDNDNALSVELSVTTDQDTPINLTNHAYFNLGEDTITDLEFTLQAHAFLEKDKQAIPTGRLISTQKTRLETKEWQTIGNYINNNAYEQITSEQGVDHCFVLDKTEPVAQLRSVKNAVQLDIFTNQNTIQLYTGQWLSSPFKPYGGVCFECQDYVDAVNQVDFPSIIVKKDTRYVNRTVLKFTQL
jgi:aldose 1-epimerase